MHPHTKVVVTGIGIVAPNGIGLEAYWDSLLNCKSGIGPITRFDASAYPVKIAGEVRHFDLRDYFGKGCRPQRYSLQTQMGLVACKSALDQAGITADMLQAYTYIPLVMGMSSSATHVVEHSIEITRVRGPHKTPLTVRAFPPAATAGAISQMFGFQASCTTISSCCPSGMDAVCEAARLVREGRADMVFAGATDSYVSPITVSAFASIGLSSSSTEFPPEEISRPFDRRRSGAVFAEGAGFLVLERLDSALARGATPLMEILDGAHFSDMLNGEELGGMARSMEQALKNAGIYPGQVDYICADAASQPTMDAAEAKMIRRVFGEHTDRIPVSSLRGVTGHSLASAALMQLVALAMIMKHQLIPPTANLTDPDPACDLQHVQYQPLRARVDIAIANSRGMAKENSTLVVRRIG